MIKILSRYWRILENFINTLESLAMLNEQMTADVFISELERCAFKQLCQVQDLLWEVLLFVSFQPMRNIPARIICMLGMDDNIFPRVERPPAFDLAQSSRRLCDPSLKLDDLGVFLETVLSVVDKLQIFYNGNSLLDGSVDSCSSSC